MDLLSRELFITKEQELIDMKEKAKYMPVLNINKVNAVSSFLFTVCNQ